MVWGFCDLVCLSFAGAGMAVEGGRGGGEVLAVWAVGLEASGL